VLNFYYAFREFKFSRFTQVSAISLKSMPKSFDLTCKKGPYPHYFKKAKNLDYMCPYPEPNIMGLVLCLVMSEYNYWNFMRVKSRNCKK
jgi:hypothetical protein